MKNPIVIAVVVADDVASRTANTGRHGHLRVPMPIGVIVQIAGNCRIGTISISIALIATTRAIRPRTILRCKRTIPAAVAGASSAGGGVATLALDVLRSRLVLTGVRHALLALPAIAVSTAEVSVISDARAVADSVSGATSCR